MLTPLQLAYDAFLQKIDEDMTGKEELIFNIFKSSLTKCYKYVKHSLSYTLDTPNEFDGYFDDELDQDELELISLEMLYEHKRRKRERIESLKRDVGTKNFNSLPDKVRELTEIRQSMKDLKEEIKEFRQEFNTFNYR